MASKKDESINGGIKRKHQSISIQDKVELLKKMDRGISVRKLCDIYGVGSSTVYDIKKQRDRILKFYADSDSKKQMTIRKSIKDGKRAEHDRVMMEWFRQCRSDGMDLSGSMIMSQAKLFHKELKLQHECDYTEGWLHRFKQRHGIYLNKVSREKRSANEEKTIEFVDEFAKLIADKHLSPEQVYNADETALYWQCIPWKTLTTEDEKDSTVFKQSKDRLTILGCSNAAGTHRCKPLVIGKSKCPRVLKSIKVYPITYRANKNGWITTEIILEWFEKFFVPEAREHCTSVGLPEDCRILLILDNCSAHPKAEFMCKKNVYTVYLPANCASLIQPQDQGILRSLKAKYCSLFMKRMLDVVNSGKSVQTFIKEFNMKDVLWFVGCAWEKVEASTLKKGWHKLWPALMFDNSSGENVDDDFSRFQEKEVFHELLEYSKSVTEPIAKDIASNLNEENLSNWMNADEEIPIGYHFTDSEIIDTVLNADKNTENNEGETDVVERLSIDKLIELMNELIKGLEQHTFVTKQELMNFHLMHEKLLKEKSRHMKQACSDEMFKKIANKNVCHRNRPSGTSANPVISTSSTPDVPTATSEIRDETINYETDNKPDPQLSDLCD